MKECLKCRAPSADAARFCSACGREFAPAEPRTPGLRKQPPQATYPVAEAVAQWKALKARKFRNGAVGAGVCIALACLAIPLRYPAASVGLVVASFFVFIFFHRFFEDDYYSIVTSRDANGSHRCIFCGNRGIWRKGVYGTNDKIAHCSKCEEELFRE